jgi:hypothetical protein
LSDVGSQGTYRLKLVGAEGCENQLTVAEDAFFNGVTLFFVTRFRCVMENGLPDLVSNLLQDVVFEFASYGFVVFIHGIFSVYRCNARRIAGSFTNGNS